MEEQLVLKVAEALQEDVGHSRARIDTKTREDLGLNPGDIIEIKGEKSTPALVWRMKVRGIGNPSLWA